MQAAKSSWKKRIQHWLITRILVVLIRVTGSTTRVRRLNHQVLKSTLEEYGSVIVATWHQNIYFSIWLLRKQELTALISSSDDGQAIYDVFAHYGYQAVRGSTTRGGIPALKQLIKLLKDKTSVAITPDGPLGPPEKIQSGVILLAKYAGVPSYHGTMKQLISGILIVGTDTKSPNLFQQLLKHSESLFTFQKSCCLRTFRFFVKSWKQF